MRRLCTIACLALVSVAAGPASGPATRPDPPPVVTYLGVITATPVPALRTQLDLPDGVGVVVEALERAGPAQTAGLALHDVITRIDDQVVVNVQQFGVLVRLRRGGETATLTVLRRGRPVNVPVVLGERPDTDDDVVARLPAMLPDGKASTVARTIDGRHTIVLTCHADDVRGRVTDAAGRLVFEGPVNTREQQEQVPAECREKLLTLKSRLDAYRATRATTSPADR